jgi:hypothetical protein
MTNAESMRNSKLRGPLSPERQDVASLGCAKVERVVLNALQKAAALPPDICVFGDQTAIAFGEADPPWTGCRNLLTSAYAITVVGHCFSLRPLIIPWSLDIRYSLFSGRMSAPRHCMVA